MFKRFPESCVEINLNTPHYVYAKITLILYWYITPTSPPQVNIGSPSEESEADEVNNHQSITVDVGEQANLVIRGTAATQRNAIKPDPTLVTDKAFLRSVKLEVLRICTWSKIFLVNL